jgi:dipeptidyl aminopeptidase/acylaminoacyl peptidase
MMGLIRDPQVFKCGVNWVGVSDINLMYSATWSDFSQQWKKFGMPVLIGDREKHAQQLKQTSPVEQAAQLKQPLLMAYGTSDRRVPIAHGQAMRDALKPVNQNVEWIEYPYEGHGWKLETTRFDFWTQVEQFLDKHIGR